MTLELLNCHSKKEKIHNEIPLSSFNSPFLCIPHTNIRDIKVWGAINAETYNQKQMASISTPNNLHLRSMRRLLTPGQKSSSQSGSWLKFSSRDGNFYQHNHNRLDDSSWSHSSMGSVLLCSASVPLPSTSFTQPGILNRLGFFSHPNKKQKHLVKDRWNHAVWKFLLLFLQLDTQEGPGVAHHTQQPTPLQLQGLPQKKRAQPCPSTGAVPSCMSHHPSVSPLLSAGLRPCSGWKCSALSPSQFFTPSRQNTVSAPFQPC